MHNLHNRKLDEECTFKATRSSGPGGQNVNKVNTQIELRFHIPNSQKLHTVEKSRLLEKLKNRVNIEGELIVLANEERSQLRNKTIAIDRFYSLINQALHIAAKRKRTKPSKASQLKRLENKKKHAMKKSLRGNNYDH